MKIYTIHRPQIAPRLGDAFDSSAWAGAEVAGVEQFHPRSSAHRPVTRVKLLRHGREIHFRFHVADRYVRCVRTGYQSMVCNDSCVELFLQPRPERGYFNFEFNCGGAMLLYYVEDPARGTGGGLARHQVVADEWCRRVQTRSTLPPRVDPEIPTPLAWELGGSFPLELLEAYAGPLGELHAQRWRGNFFKCGDETSHPHWASWSPIGDELNFHQPARFGEWIVA